MKNAKMISVNGKKNLISSIPLSESDIAKIRKEYCSPEIVATSPADLFSDLDYKYVSTKDFRRTLQVNNDSKKYFDEKLKQFNYDLIVRDFDSIKNKIKVIDSKGNETGIFILSFNFGYRDYRKIYFDFNDVKSKLNSAPHKVKS